MNKQLKCLLIIVFIAFLIVSCDLFTGSKTDILKKISEEVDWANAPKVTVTVAFPPEWGNSPQSGEGKCGDTRKGYEFGVEFIPLPSYGFEKWLAFETSVYAELDKTKSVSEAEVLALNGSGVTIVESISETGAKAAMVKIDTLEPVTLVPWCGDRPRVIQSYPPLINSGITYPCGQEIRIIFSMELEYENSGIVPFGEGYIHISGMVISDGNLLNGHGDLTGVTDPEFRYFETPVYDEGIISIKAREAKLPPANIIITVTVGTEIKGNNGNELAAPVSFSYTTDERQVIKIYQANQLWALHPGADPETQFLYQIADRQLDRRIRKKSNGDYAVTLFFGVSASSQEMNALPDTIDIVQLEYATITGNEMYDNVGREKDRKVIDTPSSYVMESVSAGSIYRNKNKNETAYYQFEYNWGQTPPSSGIYRLVALPYRKGNGAVNEVDPQTLEGAISQLRYVTVVFDNVSPGGDADIGLSGYGGTTGNVYNYSNTPETKNLRFSANFINVRDNGGEGIKLANHTSGKPWTMDEQSALEWRFRIITNIEGQPQTQNYISNWTLFNADNTGTAVLDLSTVTSLAGANGNGADVERTLQIQYKDSLGNGGSALDNTWNTIASFKYYTSKITPVTTWDAAYYDTKTIIVGGVNIDADTIHVTWTLPEGMNGVEYSVSGAATMSGNISRIGTGTGQIPNQSFDIIKVPKIECSGVRDGQPVSNIMSYTVTLSAYNGFGSSQTVFKIWNFPGISVSNTNPALEISTQADLDKIRTPPTDNPYYGLGTANAGKQYVLVNDIIVSSHTPIGTDYDNPFTGKLYGNGHSITLNNGFSGTGNYGGVFGYILGGSTQSALIRDLTVVYADTTVTGKQNVGGIVGQVNSNTDIMNCIVKGTDERATLKVTTSVSQGRVGGIVGYLMNLNNSSHIQNCRAALNVTHSSSVDQLFYVGGVIGVCSNSNTLEDLTCTAIVTAIKTGGTTSGNISACGGIVGSISSVGNNLKKAVFSGKINMSEFYSNIAYTYIGGIVGGFQATSGTGNSTIEFCETSGDIICTSSGVSAVSMGGIVGYMSASATTELIINNSNVKDGIFSLQVTGDTRNQSTFVGGFVGNINRYSSISNCNTNVRSIKVWSTNNSTIEVGGFAGKIEQANISDCSSSGTVIVPPEHTDNHGVLVGGFCGSMLARDDIISKLERCYATGDVSIYGRNSDRLGDYDSQGYHYNNGVCAGGLVGASYYYTGTTYPSNAIIQCYATGNVTAVNHASIASNYINFGVGGLVGIAQGTEISKSYATGNVSARKGFGGTASVAAGGLVGFLGHTSNGNKQKSSIENCYATGDVTADNPNSDAAPLYVGGLAGYVQIDSTKAITNSFATGTVSAKNASSDADAWAGGIVGYKVSGQLSRCVAAGRPGRMVSVSAQGGNNRYFGRVYGQSAGTAPANNYANVAIYTGTNTSYFVSPTLTVVNSSTASSENGADASNSSLSNSTFWTTAGFSATVWDFGPVAQGYPKLNNVGGQ